MYILYKTKCLIDGKIYIGIHNGTNPDYIGSGDWQSEESRNRAKTTNPGKESLAEAVAKYGRDNFERIVLSEFETKVEACNAEATIVDENFIRSDRNYNLVPGGGYPPKMTKEAAKKAQQTMAVRGSHKPGCGTIEGGKKGHETCVKRGTYSPPPRHGIPPPNQRGSKWINDGEKNRRLKLGDPTPNGWIEGRLFTFSQEELEIRRQRRVLINKGLYHGTTNQDR